MRGVRGHVERTQQPQLFLYIGIPTPLPLEGSRRINRSTTGRGGILPTQIGNLASQFDGAGVPGQRITHVFSEGSREDFLNWITVMNMHKEVMQLPGMDCCLAMSQHLNTEGSPIGVSKVQLIFRLRENPLQFYFAAIECEAGNWKKNDQNATTFLSWESALKGLGASLAPFCLWRNPATEAIPPQSLHRALDTWFPEDCVVYCLNVMFHVTFFGATVSPALDLEPLILGTDLGHGADSCSLREVCESFVQEELSRPDESLPQSRSFETRFTCLQQISRKIFGGSQYQLNRPGCYNETLTAEELAKLVAEMEGTFPSLTLVEREEALLRNILESRASLSESELFQTISKDLKYLASNYYRADGDHLLYQSAKDGLTSCVRTLCQLGDDVNRPRSNRSKAIHIAAVNGFAGIVAILAEFGANVDDQLLDGATPAILAAQEGHLEVIQILHSFQADFGIPRNNGDTPFWIAKWLRNRDLVKFFTAVLANPSSTDREHRDERFKFGHPRVLGKGAYGVVFEAFDTFRKVPIAVKVSTKSPAAVHREWRILRDLHHPSIVQVHFVDVLEESSGQGLDVDGSLSQIVNVHDAEMRGSDLRAPAPSSTTKVLLYMELMSESLLDLIKRNNSSRSHSSGDNNNHHNTSSTSDDTSLSSSSSEGVMEEWVIWRCLVDILAGLSYIHGKGLLHCDIKPSNLLFSRSEKHEQLLQDSRENSTTAPSTVNDRSLPTLKLSDFGSSQALLEDGAKASISSQLRGTPRYWSPTAVREKRNTKESDLWALGCTVVEMGTPYLSQNSKKTCTVDLKTAATDFTTDSEDHSLHEIGRRFKQESPEVPGYFSSHLQDFVERLFEGTCTTEELLAEAQERNQSFLV